jgi:hypothetical protein
MEFRSGKEIGMPIRIGFSSSLTAAVAALLALAAPVPATTVLFMPLEEQAKTAELIVVATAVASQSLWSDDGGIIYTDARFEVTEKVKGGVSGSVTTRQLGGQVGKIAQSVAGSPQFAIGRSYVLFLETRKDGFYRVVGFSQGCYPVVSSADGKRKVMPQLAGAGGVKLLGAMGAPGAGPQPLADFLAQIKSCLGESGQ